MSLPRENVLLVPNRNVLLTGSGWGGGKHRDTPHDAARSRPAGGAEAGAQAADHPETGSRAAGVHGTARATAGEEAETGWRQSGDSRTARFVAHDSTEENMRLLKNYLETNGRPLAFYTDKASLFQTAPKIARDQKELARDEREPLPPTQIGRALRELGMVWNAAHSPQA